MKNKFIIICLSFFILSNVALSKNICTSLKDELAFIFFNGVGNSPDDARQNLEAFKELYGNKTPQGASIKYDLMYNTSKGLFLDLAEVFVQRAEESKNVRYEVYFLSKIPFFYKFLKSIPFVDEFIQLAGEMQKNALKLFTQSQTDNDYRKHSKHTLDHIDEGRKMLLIGHSQGNLFLNKVYKDAIWKMRQNAYKEYDKALKALHIAPASSVLNGPYVLASSDWLIKKITNHTPNVEIPKDYENIDWFGHGLIETYLNQDLDTFKTIDGHIKNIFATIEAPTTKKRIGFVWGSVDWENDELEFYILRTNSIFEDRLGDPLSLSDVYPWWVSNRGIEPKDYYYTSGCYDDYIILGDYEFILYKENSKQSPQYANVTLHLTDQDRVLKKRILVKKTFEYPHKKANSAFKFRIYKDENGIVRSKLLSG